MIFLRNISILSILISSVPCLSAKEPSFTRDFDIIYHRQDGFAVTMEKVTPTQDRNGAAIVMVMSGGWVSNHDLTLPHIKDQLPRIFKSNAAELIKRGYTLFYVVHGTQPKFTIREIHEQMSSAIRHIRHHGADFKIDPTRIGIMGGSAGGHLSLMQGTKGEDGDLNPEGAENESDRVQAVVAYFPPTDFLNYSTSGTFFDGYVRQTIPGGKNPFLQAMDYLEYDEINIRLTKVTDERRVAEHYKDIAPLYHVTKDDAPTFLLHGDADRIVPLQQSELIAAKFKDVGVTHRLFVKKGGDHGWEPTADEIEMVADWFDEQLAKPN